MRRLSSFIIARDWARISIGTGLTAAWLLVLAGVPLTLPAQLASWLVFLALLITPGYLLGDLVTRRLGLDSLERLALALPLGVLVLAVPGLAALLQHRTIHELAVGWTIVTGVVVAAWFANGLWTVLRHHEPIVGPRWTVDELLMLLLVFGGFLALLPTLNLPKIDGDAYAVASFSADALSGLPLNATEPLFGTDLGPGVRMLFNQTLPMAYLWSLFSGVDPVTLAATASRAMPAVWALLAAYTLGRGAVKESRRMGLFTAAITLLIYAAAPFLRGDNVSLFFFERTNADKFLVPVTMLPVAFALAMRFARDGQWPAWVAAALVALAVSAIHPLVAAMLTVGLAGFAGLHLLLNVRSITAWRRGAAIGGLVIAVMALPLLQLVIARGDAPLAASYPRSFDGWPVGTRQAPVLALAGIGLPTLDYYGPLPSLAEVDASQAESDESNPFLMWRFAVNMERRRLVIFDADHYISDPNLVYEPPYLLTLLLLPWLAIRSWRRRSDVGAQFVVGSTLAALVVMFTPWLTPWVGSLVMPWILWRFVWLLPYALAIALVTAEAAGVLARLLERLLRKQPSAATQGFVMLGLVVAAALALSPAIGHTIGTLHDRTSSPTFFPTPTAIFATLSQATASGPAAVLADQDLSVTLPAYVANAAIVAHRMPTTSEVFPADRQTEALQRLIDQDAFFRNAYLTEDAVEILRRYDVRYLVTSSGSDLDTQVRLSSGWFAWMADDQSYSLYAVKLDELSATSETLRGNSALARRDWEQAQVSFESALKRDPEDLLARVGLAEIAHAQGHSADAVQQLRVAIDAARPASVPNLHHRLGQLYVERGQMVSGRIELTAAAYESPEVARFHEALGDVCLTSGDGQCAAEQYRLAVAARNLPGADSRLIAEGDLWRRRGHTDDALALYEQAASLRSSLFNHLTVVDALMEMGRFDRAEALVRWLRRMHPLTSEVIAVQATLAAAQGQIDRAVGLYRRAIVLQAARSEESSRTRLALAQVLLDANRLEEAEAVVNQVVEDQPYESEGYRLRGDLWRRYARPEKAVDDYRRALSLDPGKISTYIALRNQLRQQGGRPEELSALLEATIAHNPGEAALAIDLGDQWQRLGDTQRAIDAYGDALTQLNGSGAAAGLRTLSTAATQALVQARLAALYEDAGQMDSALAFYRAAVAAAPDVAWPRVLLGDSLRRRGQLDEAEASYRAAIARQPDQAEGYLRLADMLFAAGRGGEASELSQKIPPLALARLEQAFAGRTPGGAGLSRLLSSSSTNGSALQSDETLLSQLGQSVRPAGQEAAEGAVGPLVKPYQLSEDGGAAIESYRQQIDRAVRENRDPVVVARMVKDLGDLYASFNQTDQAETAYRQSLSLDRWWPDTLLALAEIVASRGAEAEARRFVEQAVEIAPGAVEAQLALARQQEQQGEEARALATYQAVASAHPGNAQATLALAHALQARGDFSEATHVYTQTIAMNPGVASAYTGLAEVEIDQGRYAQARASLQQALKLDQLDAVATIRAGDVEQKTGNRVKAMDWYERGAELSPPGHPSNRALLASLIAGGYYDRAERFAVTALAARPDDSELLVKLAQVYRATGRLDEARSMAQRAAESSRSDAQPAAELAQIYTLMGQPGQALSSTLQAIALQPGAAEHTLAASRLLAALGRFEEAESTLRLGVARAAQPDALAVALHELLMARGDPAAALAALDQAVDARGPQLDLLLARVDHYDAAGDSQAARQQVEEILALYPGNAGAAIGLADRALRTGAGGSALYYSRLAHLMARVNPRVLLTLSRAYREANQVDEATLVFSRTLGLAPSLEDAYLELGAIYLEQGQAAQARAVLEAGIAAAPLSGQVLGQYALLLVDQGEAERASALVAEAAQRSPSVATLLAQAAVAAKLGEAEQAIDILWSALEQEPASLDALQALSDVYTAHHWSAAAHDINARLIDLYPGIAAGYVRQAALAEAQGKRDEAADLYARGVAKVPASSELLSRYASFLAGQGQDAGARQIMDGVVKGAPSADNVLARASLLAKIGQPDEAIEEVRSVLAQHPESADGLLALGGLYEQTGKPDQAKKAYQTVVDRYPGLPAGYLRLATLMAAERETQQAGAVFEQGLAVAPYSADLLAQYAVFLADQQQTARAKELADRAVKLAPSAQHLTARAKVFETFGDVERAALDLQTALAVEPVSLEGWLALGDLYADHDRTDEAKASYERAVELHPDSPAGYLRLGNLASAGGDRKEAQRYMALAREAQRSAAASQAVGAGG